MTIIQPPSPAYQDLRKSVLTAAAVLRNPFLSIEKIEQMHKKVLESLSAIPSPKTGGETKIWTDGHRMLERLEKRDFYFSVSKKEEEEKRRKEAEYLKRLESIP